MPTPEELLHALVDAAGDELVAKAETVSVEQAARELDAAGFDVKAERVVERTGPSIVKLTPK